MRMSHCPPNGATHPSTWSFFACFPLCWLTYSHQICISIAFLTAMKRFSMAPALRAVAPPSPGAFACLSVSCGCASHYQKRWAGTQRRVIRPTEESVAELMEDADEEGACISTVSVSSFAAPAPLSAISESAALYRRVAAAGFDGKAAQAAKRRRSGHAGDGDASATDDAAPTKTTHDAVEAEALAGTSAGDGDDAVVEEARGDETYILQQQQYYYELPVQALTDIATAYLRSTENIVLVSPQEEHILFPVLMERLQEFHVSQLLDIVDSHWSRSTMLRYGTQYKDMVRDRIAQLATAAATQLEAKRRRQQEQQSSSSAAESTSAAAGAFGATGRGEGHSTKARGASEECEDDGAVFVAEKQAADAQRSADAILAHAEKEITSATVYRALVVMGISAGHRKRDLAFFQLLGNYLTFFINDYRDPHELVRVLTALARAKIVPSPAFLNMIARRMPVLHKRIPLEPLPAYRALSNFARMGHTSMNTFRFLADCMFAHVEKHISEEKKQLTTMAAASKKPAAATEESDAKTAPSTASGSAACMDRAQRCSQEVLEKERLRRMCGLKPSMFTRWLAILARFNAPHQQYLRPLIKPVILPMLPYFPPPSFTRLVSTTRVFRSTDRALVDALVGRVCDVLAPAGKLTRVDAMELLRLISQDDTPVPTQLDRVLQICKDYLGSSTSTYTMEEVAPSSAERSAAPRPRGTVTVVPRPRDMCNVVKLIGCFQKRDEIPLESLTPLLELTEDFAKRLAHLMELCVVSLTQVDAFLELCERHQIPDVSGALEQLMRKRRDVVLQAKRSPEAAAEDRGGRGSATDDEEAEEAYYGQLDIDVRETFNKILLTNDWNTHCRYRPLPGPLQVDFRNELTKVSALELLQAVDLFAKACPGALQDAPRLFLSRSLLEKLGKEGEVVVEEATNSLVIRQPRAELLTREDLQTFTALVERTPLEAVRTSPVVWVFIKEKAERLGLTSVEATATARLTELHGMARRAYA
ncbi:mitochondrial RNA binding complex 1 subunit, putative [Leishmania donovani]|uniref:Mitochondrial RNA binding complex 1 subunit, putative n=2 Tax=Leishmania donovani TaxID=5661 RepID=A0A3Q8IF71_LEIDO|nr:mitochondrial RNA binding complex 1 subunit, putative [Leishmania donovani]